MMWLLVTLLFVICGCQRLDLTSRSKVFFDESFGDARSSPKFGVQRSQLGYAELTGFGEVTFTINSNLKKEPKVVACKVYFQIMCILWNLDSAQFDENESFEISADVKLYRTQEPNSITLRVIGSDVIELNSTPRYSFYFGGASTVNLLVSFKDMPTDLTPETSKIQFYTFQGFTGTLHSSEYLLVYMKQGDSKVSEHESDRTSTSTVGFGSVMTLLKNDSDFCLQPTCQYSFRIETLNISYLEFQSALFAIQTPIKISDSTMIVDQLRENDLAIYEISSTQGNSTWNWRFNLVPVEGNPDIAINGDVKPETLEDYKWKSSLEGNEDIFITGTEIQDQGLSGNKFFIYMTSKEQSTFLMTVYKQPPFIHQHIHPNEPVTGEAAPEEIVNYFFRANLRVPEKMRMFARIKALSGDPDLYVKACFTYDTQECLISKQEIEQADTLSNNNNLFFRYSKESFGDDSLFLEFNCVPDDPKYKDFKFTGEEANLFTSQTCLFAVAVVGKSSSTHLNSKYILTLRGARYHEVLNLNDGQNFRIEQRKSANYYIDITPNMFKEPNIDQSLNFKFIIISGDADIYFSRTFPYPSARHGFDKVMMIDNNNTQLHSTIKYVSFTGKPADLKGRYYFTIHASAFLFGSVTSSINYQDFESSRPDQNIELRFGQAIMNSITATSNSSMQYYFTLDVPSSQKGVEIVLQLTPIEGKFKFCVFTGAPVRLTWDNCLWKDDDQDGNIIISQEDTNFVSNGTYSVLVLPVFTKDSEDSEFTYSLTLSSQDSYVPLTEGLTYRMLVLRSPKIFRLPLASNSAPTSDLVVLLTTFDPQAEIRMSTKKDELISNSSQVKKAVGSTATLLYSLQELQTDCAEEWRTTEICYIYIRVKPSNSTPYEYSLLAYGDDKPVFLTEDAEQSLPLPVKAQIELIHSPLNTNSSLSVNVYADGANLEVAVTVAKNGSVDESTRHNYVVNDKGTNIVHIPAGVLLNLDSPIVTITISNLDYKKDPAHFEDVYYDTTERVTVQLSSGVKRLNHLVPILETQGRKGSFIFYKFVKPVDTDAMIYLTILSGEADLYAKKGENQFPDLNTYDFRSNTLKNDELMIPASKVESDDQGNSRSRFDTYIIGVYSKLPTQFQIVASKNSSFLYYQAELGDVIIKEVPPSESMVISYINKNNRPFLMGAYGLKGPVKVFYKVNDENSTSDFFDTLPGVTDSSFQSVSKYAKRQIILPTQNQDGLQYLFKIVPTKGADYVTAFVYEEGDSLYLKGGETFHDSLDKRTCQSYKVYYDNDVVDETVTIRVDIGEVNLTISNPKAEEGLMIHNDGIAAPKEKFYSVRNVFNRSSGRSGPINVFKEYLLTVCAKEEASSFKLTTSKPSLIMQRMTPGSRFQVALHPTLYHKVFYYRVYTQSVRSLEIRVDLEKIGATMNKITNFTKLFDNIEFYYVLDKDGYGFDEPQGEGSTQENKDDKNKAVAEIIDKRVVSDGGSSTGIINFAIQNGFFIIKAKQVNRDGPSAIMQLIINNEYPISVFGKTLAHVSPGEEAHYEVLTPTQSELLLTLSSCSGTAKVEFYKADQEDNRELFKSITLKSNLDLADFLSPTKQYANYFNVKMESEVGYIKIINLDTSQVARITINSDLSTAGDSMTVADYFAQYTNPRAISKLVESVTFSEDSRQAFLKLAPIQPSSGFSKYSAFHMVVIEYTVFSSKNSANWNLASQCLIGEETAKAFDFTSSKKIDLNVDQGTLLWNREPVVLQIPFEPLQNSTHALLQMKLTFLGESSDSSDDDAVVIIANNIELTASSNLQQFGHPLVPIIGLILVACICICVYRIYRHLKLSPPVNRGVPQVRQVFEQSSGNVSNQLETIEDDSKTNSEVEMKHTRNKTADDTL